MKPEVIKELFENANRPTPKQKKHWTPSERFRVTINKKVYTGTILETAFSSEGDYDLCRCEIEQPNPLNPRQILKGERVIQSYKLRRLDSRPRHRSKDSNYDPSEDNSERYAGPGGNAPHEYY